MSFYESHNGKVRKISPLENETFEDLCKRIWVLNKMPENSYRSSDDLFSEFYKKYINLNGDLWEIFDNKEMVEDEDMFCHLTPNPNGSYSFVTRFYNGGTCLREMVEDSLREIDKY